MISIMTRNYYDQLIIKHHFSIMDYQFNENNNSTFEDKLNQMMDIKARY